MTTSAFDISVVISSFNREDKVRQTLERLFESDLQTFQKIEVLVIDDGSPKPLDQLLADIPKSPDKIDWRLIRQSNAGIGATRNRGYREAQAPVVIFLDDDILVYPDTLALLYEAQLNGPGPVIFGNYPFISHATGSLKLFAEQLYGYHLITKEKQFIKVDAITSGLLCVDKRKLPDAEAFYKDNLSVPAAEEYEIVARFSREGIPIYMATHIQAIHNHHLELPWLVIQQYKYGLGTAEAFIKYPETVSLPSYAALKKSLDSLYKGSKGFFRRVLASGPGRKLLLWYMGFTGSLAARRNRNRGIGILTSAYFWAGYRKGLMKFKS